MLNTVKRERDVGSSSNGSLSHGIAAEDTEATPKRRAAEAAVSYAHEKAWLAVWLAGVKTVSPPVLAACRAALVDSPAASRAALAKYKSSINPPLAKILTTVGSYDAEHDRTPLHESARRGDLATSTFLITAGAAVDARDKDYRTPLQLATNGACRDLLGHHESILRILRVDSSAFVSAVVAHCAALSTPNSSAPETKLTLRAHQLDPSFLWVPHIEACIDRFGWARDVYAAQVASNVQPFVDLPDDCAGDVLEYLEFKMTRAEVLHVVTHCSSPEAHAWVCEVATAAIVADATLQLVAGAFQRNLAKVKACLMKDVFVDDTPLKDCTALYWASTLGEIDIVKVLLEAGADSSAKDTMNGRTALISASVGGHTDVVKLLLEAGADVNATQKNGYTALMKASFNGHTDVVELLLEAGADVTSRDKDGGTALISATVSLWKLIPTPHANVEGVYESHLAIVKLLLEAGAGVDDVGEHRNTALILASQYSHHGIVEELLLANADTDRQNEYGYTALIEASNIGSTIIVELLLLMGADKEATDRNGQTALDFARTSLIIELLNEDEYN